MSRPIAVTGLDDTVVQVGKSTSPVKLNSVQLFNPAVAASFVQFFNAAVPGDVTLGTTVPDYVIGAATLRNTQLAGLDLIFGKGLCVAATTTSTGLTAPATAVEVGLGISDG